jgi:hypothetical protein
MILQTDVPSCSRNTHAFQICIFHRSCLPHDQKKQRGKYYFCVKEVFRISLNINEKLPFIWNGPKPLSLDIIKKNRRAVLQNSFLWLCEVQTCTLSTELLLVFCYTINFNPLNARLNPICHLLALLWAHHIFHISRLRVKHKPHYTI